MGGHGLLGLLDSSFCLVSCVVCCVLLCVLGLYCLFVNVFCMVGVVGMPLGKLWSSTVNLVHVKRSRFCRALRCTALLLRDNVLPLLNKIHACRE